MDILLECESQQRSFVSKIPLQSNLVQHSQVFDSVLAPLTGSMSDSRVMGLFSHGGRRAYRAHGRSNYGRLQCQICERLGHLTQMCYYHFDHSIDGPPVNSFSPPALMFSPLSSSYDLPASLHIWSFKRVWWLTLVHFSLIVFLQMFLMGLCPLGHPCMPVYLLMFIHVL